MYAYGSYAEQIVLPAAGAVPVWDDSEQKAETARASSGDGLSSDDSGPQGRAPRGDRVDEEEKRRVIRGASAHTKARAVRRKGQGELQPQVACWAVSPSRGPRWGCTRFPNTAVSSAGSVSWCVRRARRAWPQASRPAACPTGCR
ncbi:hypothetical protein GCM10010390_42120 [Streptomyces mordarskii]|uniref:Uncharacterized protein n=1 Tax=Streptomyces mordarskii TaxID=1226758 RepID=A0ABN1D6X2_9ACTN